jgi:hypothetical protein
MKNERIKMMKRTKRMRMTKRINASDVIDHLTQKRNARLSILSVSNVIKPVTEDLCVEPKERIKKISQREMNSLLQKSH